MVNALGTRFQLPIRNSRERGSKDSLHTFEARVHSFIQQSVSFAGYADGAESAVRPLAIYSDAIGFFFLAPR